MSGKSKSSVSNNSEGIRPRRRRALGEQAVCAVVGTDVQVVVITEVTVAVFNKLKKNFFFNKYYLSIKIFTAVE